MEARPHREGRDLIGSTQTARPPYPLPPAGDAFVMQLMKQVLLCVLLSASVTGCTTTRAHDQAEVIVHGAVLKPGRARIAGDTRLEDVLNKARCHAGSNLRRIRIVRRSHGVIRRLDVGAKPQEASGDRKMLQLQDGDMIVVPDKRLSTKLHKISVTVTGPFYILSEEVEQQ